MSDSLFLHMGPGLNAHVERTVLAQPGVLYWDQPAVRGPRAYSELVAAAATEVRRLAESCGGPIRVVAHSFGGNLLRPLLREIPELIREIEVFNCGIDLTAGFRRLLGRLGRDPETSPALRAKIAEFVAARPPNADDFWATVGLIVEDPAFMRLYWPRREEFLAYGKVAEHGPSLDFETFQAVANEYLRNPDSIPSRIPWKGAAKLVLGREDPLIEADAVAQQWRIVLPEIAVETRADSGHYAHLEEVLRRRK